MSNWKEIYNSKLCAPEQAVQNIRSGDTVLFAHAVAEPFVLVDAMVANASAYKDVEIHHFVSLGKGEYARPEMKEHFRFNGWFLSSNTRTSVAEGYADFTPVFFHEVPRYIKHNIFPIDVFLLTVSPPDKHGYCNLGVSCDIAIQAIESSRTVIAQVNEHMPVVYGDTFVHVSKFDFFVEAAAPLPELPVSSVSETERKIGKYCAALIEDGATLQLGIGSIPDAVLKSLGNKHDLGIHSEMISDGVVDLYEAGIITNEKKSIHKGKMVVSFLMGTKRLYDFVDHNPAVEMRVVSYVNHPSVIAQNSKLVCINSCLAVDFMGQIAADAIGPNQFSGVGGQVDFMRGAAMSTDGKGKGIIAMPSVAVKKDGSMISKIVPCLEKGSAVTTSRHDVDYVITEYGIASLKGKTLRERALNLIEIAHPVFKDELIFNFENNFKTNYKNYKMNFFQNDK